MNQKLFLCVCVIVLFSCSKNGKDCWQGFDQQGYDATGLILCDKTKSEAESAYPQYWFYKTGEKKYCWKVELGSSVTYNPGIPESIAKRYVQENAAYRFTKVDCNSFCHLKWLEKHKGKLTNLYNPTRVFVQTIFSADDCSKLSIGQVVVVRETTDSIITRELIEKYP